MSLLSEDYGKHLLGVEDLLQKHSLVEADIAAQADRVQSVNEQADVFLHMDNEEDGMDFYFRRFYQPENSRMSDCIDLHLYIVVRPAFVVRLITGNHKLIFCDGQKEYW